MVKCPRCGSTTFGPMRDFILTRDFPWINKYETVQCLSCGAKIIICPKCGEALTEMNIVNRSVITPKCPHCGYEIKELTEWLKSIGEL